MTVALAERPATFASAPVARPSISDKLAYCRELAASGMLPRQYQQQPANLLYAVEYADSLGLHPMVAITGVHVIEGKPSASAALISALVRRAGHRLRVTGDARSATAQIVRADDPDFTFSVTFTWADAVAAGLTGKAIWKKYTAAMLKARAITAVARDACEEALFGVHYTPEELGAVVDQEGNPVYIEGQVQRDRAEEVQQPPAPARDYLAEAVAAAFDELDEIEEAARENGAPAPYLAALADVRTAHAAQDVKAVRELHRTLQEAGADAVHLARIATIGATKPGAKAPEQSTSATDPAPGNAPADDGSRPADETRNAPLDAAELAAVEAEQRLRLAASKAGLDTLDADFESAYGVPVKQAPAALLDQMTQLITKADQR